MTGKRQDSRGQSGAAMVGAGSVVGGTGLIAGGIPGAKEPNALDVWHLRGLGRSRAALSNIGHNGKIVAPQPRAGILGFRANTHDFFIQDTESKKGGTAYERGNRAGKLEAERKIVPGMRLARRATHPVTLGGTALAVAGAHRMSTKPVRKRDSRERGGAAGTAGAAAGGVAGTAAGVRGGASAGRTVIDAKLNAEWAGAHGSSSLPRAPKGQRYFVRGGDAFPRRVKAMEHGAKAGVALGVPTLGIAGYRLARGRKVNKANQRRQNTSAAALGAGATTAGVAHFVPKPLDRFGRHYAESSQAHVRAAQQLAPRLGGLQKIPAKVNGFGVVIRPEKDSLKPETPNWKFDPEKNPNARAEQTKIPTKHRAAVGHHRGVAAQEKHFAEVFEGTGRMIRRFRGPGLAVAGAGATGLWASRDVRKSVQYGYQERKRSLPRTAEFVAGGVLAAYGASRLNMVGSLARYGARIAEKQGAKPEQIERVLSAATAVGRGVRDTTGAGEAQARRVKALDNAIRAVPYGLRPAVATTAGVMLMQHAHPTTRETFTPVRFPR